MGIRVRQKKLRIRIKEDCCRYGFGFGKTTFESGSAVLKESGKSNNIRVVFNRGKNELHMYSIVTENTVGKAC
jgi:hypothetical protein